LLLHEKPFRMTNTIAVLALIFALAAMFVAIYLFIHRQLQQKAEAQAAPSTEEKKTGSRTTTRFEKRGKSYHYHPVGICARLASHWPDQLFTRPGV
jgi:flagellar biosynthesis/type III secretory pathway M-ring protein FliF/YscJ